MTAHGVQYWDPSDLQQQAINYSNAEGQTTMQDAFESSQVQHSATFRSGALRLRYTRVKDVGTRHATIEQRKKRITEIAKALPPGNKLNARSIYWFVATENVEIIIDDPELFILKEASQVVDDKGVNYHIYQIEFRKNRSGAIEFRFSNGEKQVVYCSLTGPKPNKRIKLTAQGENNNNEEDSPNTLYPTNTNDIQEMMSLTTAFLQASPPPIPNVGQQIQSNQALIVNIFILVPDTNDYIQMAKTSLNTIGFTKEVSSVNQELYSQSLETIRRHVLLLPYGRMDRFLLMKEYLLTASEVILVIENEAKQENILMSIAKISNNTGEDLYFAQKSKSYQATVIDYTALNMKAKLLMSIGTLRNVVLGGVICSKPFQQQVTELFTLYLMEWTLEDVPKHFVPNIYLCFKTEPKPVKAFTEYARETLNSLGIEYEYVFNGDQMQDTSTNMSQSSVTTNQETSTEEMSISEHTYEQIDMPPTVDKLHHNRIKVLEEKCTELRKFDNKWTKTLEECYNSDKLRQQLFNFKTDKNARIAVRVFVSSASAGLATNVAKLLRRFRGKSIVDGVHSGLQIANTIIEWNQSGIVHIGELRPGAAVAVLFDAAESVKFDFTEEIVQKMIAFIQKWNTEHHYSGEFNSHRFVQDFLQYTLNIPLTDRFKGPLGMYMDYVMKTGDATPRLFSQSCGMIAFKTHEELEEADHVLRNKLSDDEIKLVKIFHRGFQLEEAANGKDVSSCCYGLPTMGLEILNDIGNKSERK